MRTVVGVLVAAAVGIHCSAQPDRIDTSTPELVEPSAPEGARRDPPSEAAPPPTAGSAPADHLERRIPDLSTLIQDSESVHVTSTVVDETGATYATGTFVDDVVIGNTLIKSRGDKDVFVLKVDAGGAFEWIRAVGSANAERVPRVTLEGSEVNVIGMTMGAMDCGAGPLPTWSSDTFFFCVFGAKDGVSISGGVFPTGMP